MGFRNLEHWSDLFAYVFECWNLRLLLRGAWVLLPNDWVGYGFYSHPYAQSDANGHRNSNSDAYLNAEPHCHANSHSHGHPYANASAEYHSAYE